MNQVLAMFPGQGSQAVGMGASLLENFPDARLTFEEAEDSVRFSIRKLCLEGPAHKLELTSNQQPSILTLSVAIWRVLSKETSIAQTEFYAGHSLGEYSALVASNQISLTKAVKLVHLRGQAMQEAVPIGMGAMAAVIGYDENELLQKCKQLSSEYPEQVLEVVNFNSPGQQIVSGHAKLVDILCQLLEKHKVRTVKLAVSAPFHSSLMKPARLKMTPLLKDLNFSKNSCKVIPNLTGKIEESYHPQLLIDQIDKPVLWSKSLSTAYQLDIRNYVEVGPGKVLFGLAKRSLPRKGSKFFNTENLTHTISELNQILH